MMFSGRTESIIHPATIKYSLKSERQLLKAILLNKTHQFLAECFASHLKLELKNHSSMESYLMDNKILQLLIQGIVDSEQYTLEGIAFYTNIPFDVIYDAACGISNHLSITTWTKIVNLYLQVKPEVAQLLSERLKTFLEKRQQTITSILSGCE